MSQKSASLIKAFQSALGFFCTAALLGLVMRFAFSTDLPSWINYSHIRHAHSHAALLGWLFPGFYLLIIISWNLSWAKHIRLFIAAQALSLGMLLSFPFMGYALLSILFSSLHILLCYWIIWTIWKDITSGNRVSEWCLKASLIFFVIATLGTWSLGYLMAEYKGTAIYYAAIQWYLHFMFNGWMIFALLAVLFKYAFQCTKFPTRSLSRRFFWLLTLSTVLTFALAVTWSSPHPAIFLINSVGVVLQLGALYLFYKMIVPIWSDFASRQSRLTDKLLRISLAALAIKILIQAAVVLPFIAKVSYTIKNFVVGFVHLLMLGCLSLFIIAMVLERLQLKVSSKAVWVFVFGIVSTEALLFLQGCMLWGQLGFMTHYYDLISLCSLIMVSGVLWMSFSVKPQSSQLQ